MARVLLLVFIVVLALWLLAGRRRGRDAAPPSAAGRGQTPVMVACAHCGVHLPRSEAEHDAAGRAYCGEAHRLAGPR